METTDTLQQAIDYAREGNRSVASRLLARYVTQDPSNDTAWLWLAACLDDPDKQRYCLRKANEINPNNPNTIENLSSFLSEPVKKPAKPAKPARQNAIAMPAPEIPVTPDPTPVRNAAIPEESRPQTKRGLTQAQRIILAVLILAIVIVIAVLAYMVLVADPTFLPSLFKSFMGG